MSAPDKLTAEFSSKAEGLDFSDIGLEEAGYSGLSQPNGLIEALIVKAAVIAPMPVQNNSSEQNNNANPKAQEFAKVAASTAPVGKALGKEASDTAIDNRAQAAQALSRNFTQQAALANKPQSADKAPAGATVAGTIAAQATGPLKMAGVAAIGGALAGPAGAAAGVTIAAALDVAALLRSSLVGQGTYGQPTGPSSFSSTSTKSGRDGGSVGYVTASSASAIPVSTAPTFNTSLTGRAAMGIAEINIASDGLNGNTKPGAFNLKDSVFAKSLEGMMRNVREVAASKGIDSESKGYDKPLGFEAPPSYKMALAIPSSPQGLRS